MNKPAKTEVNMSKVYLVDSENIGASWSQLLQTMSQEDKMFVFYTDKSPYISYDNLLQVIAYHSVPVFVKCYEGKNALDFQLVSELGFKLCQDPEAEFIIISDDYGYDAAVKYWKERSYNVHRIGKKYCKPVPRKLTEEDVAVQAVADEVTGNVADEAVAEPVPETEVIAEVPESVEEAAVSEEVVQTEEQAEVESPVQITETALVVERDQAAEEISSEEQPKKEAEHQDSLREKQAQKRGKDHGRMRRKEPVVKPEAETETSVVRAEEVQKEEQKEESKEEQKDPLELLLPDITRKCGSKAPELDAYCVWELFHSLTMSDLTNVNTALKILIGNELGNDIYRELKEHQECRTLLDALYFPEIKNRFNKYVQTVLERSDLAGVTAEEFGDFLFSIPRKNLNSIRSSIIKKYGQEQGSLIYTIFKPHIKVLNKI